jgi:glycosyltransferase involved in cell wall biosynthesis
VADLSIITTCKGRLDQLTETLPRLAAQTDCEVILIDYDCPDGAAQWAHEACPTVRIVSAPTRPRFNVSDARNLGAAVATSPWLMFLDADVVAVEGLAQRLLALATPGSFRIADPRPSELCGAILVAAGDYHRAGGFDEAFQGWGSEDLEFLARLELLGLERLTFPAAWLSVIWHDDAARTAFHDVADRKLASAINALYCHAKLGLVRMGVNPDLPTRLALHAEARAAMEAAAATGETAVLRAPVREVAVHGKIMATTLEVRFDPP